MLPFLIPSCAVHGIANTRQSPSARWSPLLRREGWRRWRHQYYQGGEKGQYLSLRGLSRSRSPRKCWGTAGAPAFRCAKGFFFGRRLPYPAGHGADPRGGHPWEPAVQAGFPSLLPNARPRTQPLGRKFGSALPETRELCCSAPDCTYAGGESLPIYLRCIGEGCFYGTSRVNPPHYPLPVP